MTGQYLVINISIKSPSYDQSAKCAVTAYSPNVMSAKCYMSCIVQGNIAPQIWNVLELCCVGKKKLSNK